MLTFEGMVAKNVTGEIYQLWRTFLKLMLLGPKEVSQEKVYSQILFLCLVSYSKTEMLGILFQMMGGERAFSVGKVYSCCCLRQLYNKYLAVVLFSLFSLEENLRFNRFE